MSKQTFGFYTQETTAQNLHSLSNLHKQSNKIVIPPEYIKPKGDGDRVKLARQSPNSSLSEKEIEVGSSQEFEESGIYSIVHSSRKELKSKKGYGIHSPSKGSKVDFQTFMDEVSI